MLTFTTRLFSHYPWTKSPLIVGAPMRVLSGPQLAVAVSAAGGLGFIGPGAKTQDMVVDLIEVRKQLNNHPQLLIAGPTLLPVGVGFQVWNDDLSHATQMIQEYRPCATWLYAPRHFNDLQAWSSSIRQASNGTAIWVQVGTIGEIEKLLDFSDRPDVIVLQGAEAGGHGRSQDGIGLMTLLPEIQDLLCQREVDVPVIAAGGIADGRGAAASLCLGADGIAMGTRFLASSEARISKGYQQEIVRASDGAANTTRTLLYNHLRGTFGWPREYAPRTIINRSFIDHDQGVAFEDLQNLHDEAAAKGDAGWGPEGRLATYAGASVGLINDVKPAGEIVQSTRNEVNALLGLAESEVR